MFQKPRFPELKFEGDRRILSMCVILALEAKRLPHKGCKAYLAHIINTSTLKVTLESVLVVRDFSDVILEDLPRLPTKQTNQYRVLFPAK